MALQCVEGHDHHDHGTKAEDAFATGYADPLFQYGLAHEAFDSHWEELSTLNTWRDALHKLDENILPEASGRRSADLASLRQDICHSMSKFQLHEHPEAMNQIHDEVYHRFCYKQGKWQESLLLLHLAHTNKTPATPDSYRHVLGTLANASRWEDALCLLREMTLSRLRPDLVSYNAAIFACSQSGRWRHACHLLSQLRQDNLAPDEVTYLSVVRSCSRCKEPRWATALKVLEEVDACGLRHSKKSEKYIQRCMQATCNVEALATFNKHLESCSSSNIVGTNNKTQFVVKTSGCGLVLPVLPAVADHIAENGLSNAIGSDFTLSRSTQSTMLNSVARPKTSNNKISSNFSA